MSLIPDKEKCANSFQIPHVPPIRKLFSSINTDDNESNVCESDTFKVFLRIKPNFQLSGNKKDCIKIEDSIKLICKPPLTSKFKKLEKVEYTFSHIFGPKTTQTELFSKCVVNCVEDLLLARNSLIFAYGTTNAGKTFTVQGTPRSPGIIPQALHTLFSNIEIDDRVQYKPCMAKDILQLERSTSIEEKQIKKEILRSFHSSAKSSKSSALTDDPGQFMKVLQKTFIDLKNNKPKCAVWISFLEVYNETIYDLLDSATVPRKPLKLAADLSDNFYVKELKQISVCSAEEAFTIYQFGNRNLNVASTKLNENSSRSHCIFTIHVINLDDDEQPVVSKLCICDLAGTERLTKTQNTGQRLKESGNINGSLFQLNRCLRAIRENQTKHTNQLIPYRHSNLTKLLHSALDDRTDERIIMIVNINPSAELYDETQQVLKMCAIASKIKNKPITNRPQQSNQFAIIYGRETTSMEDERYNELFDDEEDLSDECDEPEVQELKDKLMRQEEEMDRLKEHMKFRENYHENTKKNLKEYCDKMENTYQNRVKSLEERLKSQKEYYLWKISDVKHTTCQESESDDAIKEELSKKDNQIEELEKKLLELQCDEEGREFTKKEELSKKDALIEELENALHLKQNAYEEMEQINESLKEKLSQITIEHETILHQLEQDRDSRLAAQKTEIEKLRLDIEKLQNERNCFTSDKTVIEKLNQQIETLQNETDKDLAEQKRDIEKLNQQIEALQGERDSRLAEKNREIEKLNQEIEALKNERNVSLAEIKNLYLVIETLKNEKERSHAERLSEVEKLKLHIEKLDLKIESLKNDRELSVTAHKDEIAKLNEEIEILKSGRYNRLADQKSNAENWNHEVEILKNEKFNLKIEKCDQYLDLEQDYFKTEENNKRYNTRRNNRTPVGKENRFFKGTPTAQANKSKKRGKPKTPLQDLDDSTEANVFRNIPEEGMRVVSQPLKNMPTEKRKLFASSPLDLLSEDFLVHEPSRDRFAEITTPAETVKIMRRKK